MSARWARVSTFWTRVGFPPSPRSDSRGGVAVGVGIPRSIQCTTALASPATNRSAAVTTRIRTGSARARRRSATASSTISRTEWCTTITAWRAPTSSAASAAPSRTRCGDRASRTLSFALAGSPSVPFATTTGACPGRHRGQFPRGGETGAAPAGEPGSLHLIDQRRPARARSGRRAAPARTWQGGRPGWRARPRTRGQQPGQPVGRGGLAGRAEELDAVGGAHQRELLSGG